MLDLAVGRPSDSMLPLAELSRALAHRASLNDHSCLQYGPEQGSTSFRSRLAAFLTGHYGVLVSPERLLVTGGASHGLDLILAKLTQPGDTIWVEDPTYFLAFNVFKDRQLRLVPMPTDAHGLDVSAVERQLRRERPTALYTIPTFHNPTGMTLPAPRRQRLVELAKEHGFVIIADEVYHILGNKENMPPPLSSYDGESVLSLGSFSKILGPGLRLGWIEGASRHIEDLGTNGVLASGGGSNPFVAAIVESAMVLGIQDQCLTDLKTAYDRRRMHMIRLLQELLPKSVRFVPPEGGYFIWLELPETHDACKLREHALAENLDFKPGPIFSCERHFRNYIRVCGTFLDETKLPLACERLANLVKKST